MQANGAGRPTATVTVTATVDQVPARDLTQVFELVCTIVLYSASALPMASNIRSLAHGQLWSLRMGELLHFVVLPQCCHLPTQSTAWEAVHSWIFLRRGSRQVKMVDGLPGERTATAAQHTRRHRGSVVPS